MSEQTDTLIRQLSAFGLSLDESRIYCELSKNEGQSALMLSRTLHIARTRVYRLLDKMISSGIIRYRQGERGFQFETGGVSNLELLVIKKEHEAETLKKTLPDITNELEKLSNLHSTKSKIVHYTGKRGVEQATWNSLKAKNTICIFEISDMSVFLDQSFAERVRNKFVEQKIKVYEITGKTHLKPWTEVTEFAMHYWECRYMDPVRLSIKFETLLYNNVFAVYGFHDNELFCVEIYNQNLAEMQKQMFDFIWQNALPMKRIGEHGEVKI